MGEMILNAITENVLDIVIAVISIVVSVYLIPLIKNELKPWLEEKRIYIDNTFYETGNIIDFIERLYTA